MTETPESETMSVAITDSEVFAERSSVRKFLTHLVFEGHGLRIGLELSFCIIAYLLLSNIVPWNALGIPARWSALVSWFSCCTAVIIFDQLFLCRSQQNFRNAYLLSLGGAYEKALEVLESVAPTSSIPIPIPHSLYHLHRADILCHAKEFSDAEIELRWAERAGTNKEEVTIRRSRLLRASQDHTAAKEELDAAELQLGKTPLLRLEQALYLIEQRKDFWDAKSILQEVIDQADIPHPAGETSHELAKAYISITDLWTGQAEKGLEQITRSIDIFRTAIIYIDYLRPILARLLLERAYYHATHKASDEGVEDLRSGISFCCHPKLLELAEKIREELEWRHDIILPSFVPNE